MHHQAIWHQRRMAESARLLHYHADALVNELQASTLLREDTAAGDEARAALENARRWRCRMEAGE